MKSIRLILAGVSCFLITIMAQSPDQAYSRKLQVARAMLINTAYADALGRVTEFIPTTQEIYATYGPQGVHVLSQVAITHPVTGETVAPYTDDTVMALLVLETYAHCYKANGKRGVDTYKQWPALRQQIGDELARSFAQLFSRLKYEVDPLFAIRAHGRCNASAGKQLQALINAGKDKTPEWYLQRSEKEIAYEGGCGSVMRAWVLGLLFADPETYQVAAVTGIDQSELTHRHPIARNASSVVAIGVSCALMGNSVEDVVETMIGNAEFLDKQELHYKTNAKKWPKDTKLTPAMIAKDQLLTSDMIRYAYEAARAGKTPQEVLGTHNKKNNLQRSTEGFLLGWAADEAVAAAVYLFVRNSTNVKKAIVEGVNTPGDSDSIACLAAALVSAKTGQVCEDPHLELLENKQKLEEFARLAASM